MNWRIWRMCDDGDLPPTSPSLGHCHQQSDSSTGPGQRLARSVARTEIVASKLNQSGIVAWENYIYKLRMLSHHWHTAVHDSIRQELYGLWVLWHQSQSSPMFLVVCLQTVRNNLQQKMASHGIVWIVCCFWYILISLVELDIAIFWYAKFALKIFAVDIWTCICRGLSAAMTCHWRKAVLLLRANVVPSQALKDRKIAHPVCHKLVIFIFWLRLELKVWDEYATCVTWYNVIPFQR